MNAVERLSPGIVGAQLDAGGRLVAADVRLATLNAQAGGAQGEGLAIPALATVARLAMRLGIVISRRVSVAADDTDIEMWVRAQPEPGGVRLAIANWRETPTWRPADLGPDLSLVQPGEGDWRWETDAALRLTMISPAAGPRHGFDPQALLGRPLTALFAFDGEGDGLLPVLSALAARTRLEDQPARLRATGTPLLLSAIIRSDGQGSFAGFVGVARCPETDDHPGQSLPVGFTDGLERALRTPLSRIVAHADSINAGAEGAIGEDYAGYAADIASAGRHLLGLVDDLVDLNAIERPDFTLVPEAIDLADVARRAAGLLSVRANHARVAVVRPDPDAMCPAHGDFRRALQIMVNLIGNAIRYTPPDGQLRVDVVRDGDEARAVVVDHGKGIAPADQARIFEKFERLDPTEAGSNGLGLYIARKLARAMGGDLKVESAPGAGASFAFTLPAR